MSLGTTLNIIVSGLFPLNLLNIYIFFHPMNSRTSINHENADARICVVKMSSYTLPASKNICYTRRS